MRAQTGELFVRDDNAGYGTRPCQLARARLCRQGPFVILDLASELARIRRTDGGMGEQREARHGQRLMTTGSRTISSTEPSRGLRLKTSTMPIVSEAGGANVTFTL